VDRGSAPQSATPAWRLNASGWARCWDFMCGFASIVPGCSMNWTLPSSSGHQCVDRGSAPQSPRPHAPRSAQASAPDNCWWPATPAWRLNASGWARCWDFMCGFASIVPGTGNRTSWSLTLRAGNRRSAAIASHCARSPGRISLVRYGEGGMRPNVSLPCGGSLEIMIEYLPPDTASRPVTVPAGR
jgi:hypothetical protein